MTATADEAARFALEHAHYGEDLPFWRAAAARLGGPVLDVGAAAGRVTLALAADGHEVWAVDRSPAMVEQLARAVATHPGGVEGRVHPLVGDMRALELGRAFPLVIVPMNTLQVLTARRDRVACLRSLAAHLEPEGELIFDVALPDVAGIEATLGHEIADAVHVDEEHGETLHHSARYDRWDPLTQTLEFTRTVRARHRDGSVRRDARHHRVHLFMPVELDHLLEGAGLVTIATLGDFDGTPLEGHHTMQIRRCRRARP